MKKQPIIVPDFAFTSETFNLAIVETLDGEKITRQQEEARLARLSSEARQAHLPMEANPDPP